MTQLLEDSVMTIASRYREWPGATPVVPTASLSIPPVMGEVMGEKRYHTASTSAQMTMELRMVIDVDVFGERPIAIRRADSASFSCLRQ